jgi:di/tricarboxylate transporter
LGGTVTLIGTSTNLIVDSFLIEHGHPGFAFFDFTIFGITAGIACGLLLYLLSPILPTFSSNNANYQRYLLEADVEHDSELIGKSVEENHLRNLPELFLLEIIRDGQIISPVAPDTIIASEDKLIFSGNVAKIDGLNHIKGLTMFAEANGLLKDNLTEVIVSNRSTIRNKTLKQVGFRALFDAGVVAIRRDGESISGKLGELKIQAGDYLLLATGHDFQKRDNVSKNFFIVSEQKVNRKLSNWQERITLLGFLAVIVLAARYWQHEPSLRTRFCLFDDGINDRVCNQQCCRCAYVSFCVWLSHGHAIANYALCPSCCLCRQCKFYIAIRLSDKFNRV